MEQIRAKFSHFRSSQIQMIRLDSFCWAPVYFWNGLACFFHSTLIPSHAAFCHLAVHVAMEMILMSLWRVRKFCIWDCIHRVPVKEVSSSAWLEKVFFSLHAPLLQRGKIFGLFGISGGRREGWKIGLKRLLSPCGVNPSEMLSITAESALPV